MLIKASFWRWPERDLAGNTIDFFMQIEGKTFQEAMQIILVPRPAGAADRHYDSSERKIPEERGNVPETVR